MIDGAAGPYFPGWPDTLQLNYGNPATQDAMIGELVKIDRPKLTPEDEKRLMEAQQNNKTSE